MKNEIGLEPNIIKKLERRATKKAKIPSYELWIWGGYTLQIDPCKTIEEARSMWHQAKLDKWDKWELRQGETVIKKGVF